ncbi:hypothetical protein AB1484_27240 [Parafrankia sp. FMc6]|uniref:hypothetical protein n=1 Tax=Parafrankia soli TaxID=2599596 RepID=UPI0034D4B766
MADTAKTTVRADQLRPGDQIEYASAWRTVRRVTTVTSVTADGVLLAYEPDTELTARRPEPATPGNVTIRCHECGVIERDVAEDDLAELTDEHVLTIHHPGVTYQRPKEAERRA